ncbi:MAG: ABC transporter ATP-binding protein [Candidatus Thiodiazotropha sp. (ex Epidulcina cf. delphinae)]|nr:ABC transporter ATP-binding protein [Candidatus Thiodiazotropha sp. (ex Epidulcina cf. delphinae)]
MSDPVILTLSALNKRFGKREVLHDIELVLRPGECTLLSGGNGAGKTTLLRILSGLERPDSSRIDTGRGSLSWRRSRADLQKRVLYLHQQPYMFDGSVRYNLGYALPGGLSKQQRNSMIDQAIDWAELDHLHETPAKSLSGGERQRVSLARAWLRNPQILLLDEPTANLDQEARRRTLDLLRSFKKEGVSLLLASHDPIHFSSMIDRRLHLYDGRLAAIEDRKLMQIPTSPALRSTA